MVLKAAVELGVHEIIKKTSRVLCSLLSAQEIASQLPAHSPQAPLIQDAMLRLLSARSVLTCSRSDTGQTLSLYGLAPVSKYFVQNHNLVSLAPLLSLIPRQDFP